jgi:eukaryotic-like serine/threonine-protein kinase
MGPREPYDPDGRTEIIDEERAPVRRRPPWWRERWWIWFLILLLAVGALIGYAFWREEDEEAADRTVVPAVVGLQEEQARAELDEAGLDAEIERRESSEPEGIVVDQDPEAGAQLAEDQDVRLVISSGETETEPAETETVVETETVEAEPQPTEMPDVAGVEFQDAADTILGADLLPTSYPVESSEPQAVVLSQNPDSGTELPEGSIVRMNVSLGPGSRAEGEIPDVTGPEAEQALRDCHDAGFTCRLVERAAPDEESSGEIIDQDPAAGVQAPGLTQITLFLGT